MNTASQKLIKDDIAGGVEQYKAIVDHLKHLSTLSTGSILILFTFLQNFVKQPIGREWARISVLFLLLSVGAGVIAFAILAVRLPRRSAQRLTVAEKTIFAGSMVSAWASFFLGLCCLGAFFVSNT
jgi:hypothetical protein